MKKVYVSHSKDFNFVNQLYEPLRSLKGYEFIFPHETRETRHSKETIRHCLAMIAEVSILGHGTGIEIGWADAFNVPIICLYKKGTKPSNALQFVTSRFIEYDALSKSLPQLKKTLQCIP